MATEIGTEVLPFHAVVTYAPAGMLVPDTTAPVVMPIVSATVMVVAPEEKLAVVETLETVLAFSSSVVALGQVETFVVQ